jgi:hypothetical protein
MVSFSNMTPPLMMQSLRVFHTRGTALPYRFLSHLQRRQWNSRRYLWSGHRVSFDDSTTESNGPINPGAESPDSKLSATGISLATRMSMDRKFQCTQFDKKGDIYMGHGHIQRSELVSKVSIIFSPSTRNPSSLSFSTEYCHVIYARSMSLSCLLSWFDSPQSWST